MDAACKNQPTTRVCESLCRLTRQAETPQVNKETGTHQFNAILSNSGYGLQSIRIPPPGEDASESLIKWQCERPKQTARRIPTKPEAKVSDGIGSRM